MEKKRTKKVTRCNKSSKVDEHLRRWQNINSEIIKETIRASTLPARKLVAKQDHRSGGYRGTFMWHKIPYQDQEVRPSKVVVLLFVDTTKRHSWGKCCMLMTLFSNPFNIFFPTTCVGITPTWILVIVEYFISESIHIIVFLIHFNSSWELLYN